MTDAEREYAAAKAAYDAEIERLRRAKAALVRPPQEMSGTTSEKPWKDWQRGPVPLGEALERVIALLGAVEPKVLEKVSAAMRKARFDVTVAGNSQERAHELGATIAMTIPSKVPSELLLVLMCLGYPEVLPSSITPMGDRVRAYWQYGNAPKRGELVAANQQGIGQ